MKKRIGWMFAYLVLVSVLVMAVAACSSADDDAADDTTTTTQDTTTDTATDTTAADTTTDTATDTTAADTTTDTEADEEMAEEVMEEDAAEEEMAEEVMEEDMTEEEELAAAEEAGIYIAKPVVGEIFITSASEINEENIFKARGLSVWTDDPPNFDSILRLRGTDYPTWDSDKRGTPTAHIRLMDDTLIRFRADNPMEPWDLRPLPSLAESWEFPNDTTLVFHLRKGVLWHDISPVNGRELVADDVVYSFERRLRPGGRHGAPLGPIDSITALDDHTVEFKFKEPFAPFMTVIGVSPYSINPPEAEEEFGGLDDWEAAIRTGPWQMVDVELGLRTEQVRHPNYWRGTNGVTGEDLPYVRKIYGVVIPDEPAAIAAYRSGLLDAGVTWAILGAWGALKDQMITFLDKPELVYNYHPAGGGAWTTYYFGAKNEGAFANKKIRWGVGMFNDISFEAWAPCCGGAQPTRWAAMDNPWFATNDELTPDGLQFYTNFPENTMDLAKAQQYVREGKIELGLDPDDPIETTITIAQPDTAILDIAERIVADLSKIGIKAEIVANDQAQFQSVVAGDFTGLVVQYVTPAKDPNSLFYNRFHSESEFNQPGVSDAYLDDLIERGQVTIDAIEREQIYKDIQIHLAEMQYDWAVPNWTNENVFPEWVKNPGPFTTGRWIQDMYITSWVDDTHPTRASWEWEE